MGSEAICTVHLNGAVSEAKVLLETSEIVVRGGPRLKIAFKDITQLAAKDGTLTLTFSGGVASFELGKNAEKWAQKIKNPRGLLDKLGVNSASKVAAINVSDEDFLAQLGERVPKLAACKPGAELDVLFFGVEQERALVRLASLQKAIKKSGAVWVVSPKGKGTPVTESAVMSAAKVAGLVDVKVAAFSQTHTALKLVIPVAKR